jgi:hypothetical protein
MKLIRNLLQTLALSLLLTGAFAHAASVSGTVTDKTTGKPAAGDAVVLVDVQAGMGEVAHATTDASGHYTLNTPGSGPYLIRVTHQGAGYFIAAPQGGGPGDIPVYDVAAKVQGVFIEADVLEAEADNGQLKINERYFVHNTGTPPTTQWSQKSFEIVLPPDATVTDTGAQRPSGLPTSIKMDPDGPKGHYSFNFPIQPDEGEKDTLFQISYTLPYSSGKYAFKSSVSLPADNFAILMPKSMTFVAGAGADFKTVNEDPGVQTFLLKNAVPGKTIEFTISGTGSIPREQQNSGATQPGDNSSQAGAPTSGPGGGIGTPINTPDPLTKYKWWILGGLALLLVAAAAFLLRKPGVAPVQVYAPGEGQPGVAASATSSAAATATSRSTALLQVLKDELFAIESERINGTLSQADYAEQKAALEIVLKRALSKR